MYASSVTHYHTFVYKKSSQYLQAQRKKVVTTKYLAKFQGPRAITRPKIIGPERNVNLICNLSLYTHIPNIKSISQSIAKKSGDNCFISELRNWVTLYVPATQWRGHKNIQHMTYFFLHFVSRLDKNLPHFYFYFVISTSFCLHLISCFRYVIDRNPLFNYYISFKVNTFQQRNQFNNGPQYSHSNIHKIIFIGTHIT